MVGLGLIKSIGVSNFNERQVQRIIDNATIKPVNLQIEMHLYLQQKSLVEYCKQNDVLITAYAPLGSKGIKELLKSAGIVRDIPDLLDNAEVKRIAGVHNKTAAQVLLRFLLDNGVATIPKSTNETRLKQNIDVFDFELTAADMSALATQDQGVRVCDFAFFQGYCDDDWVFIVSCILKGCAFSFFFAESAIIPNSLSRGSNTTEITLF